MPSRFVVRNFTKGGYYHIYNQGVEKRTIFLDAQDYEVFIYYLYIYLKPLKKALEDFPKIPSRLQKKNVSSEVDLIAYALLPNHFHLILRQQKDGGISQLMKQVTNAYTYYFNEKYEREGALMQGRFKAISIPTDTHLVLLTKYLHLHPLANKLVQNIREYKWSSFLEYVDKAFLSFCKTRVVLTHFTSTAEFEKHTQDLDSHLAEQTKIQEITFGI